MTKNSTLKFVQFSDLHIAKESNCIHWIDDKLKRSNFKDSGGLPTSYDDTMLSQLSLEVNENNPDFVLITGDIVTLADEDDFSEAYNLFCKDGYKQLHFYEYTYMLPGNHDRMFYSLYNAVPNTDNILEFKSDLKLFEKSFKDKWTLNSRYKVIDKYDIVLLFSDFTLPNDCLESEYLTCKQKMKMMNGNEYFGNGRFTNRDQEELESLLKNIQIKYPDKEIIFMSHFPLKVPKVLDKYFLKLQNNKCLIKLLNKYNITYYIAGHTHDHHYKKIENLHQITCGTSSSCRRDGKYNYILYEIEIEQNTVIKFSFTSYVYNKESLLFEEEKTVELVS